LLYFAFAFSKSVSGTNNETRVNSSANTEYLASICGTSIKGLPKLLAGVEKTLADTASELEAAKIEVQKSFPQEDELREKSARLDAMNAELNLDSMVCEVLDGDVDEGEKSPKRHEKECEMEL
jgi:ATP-dependent protease HslVU (ClpYQ) peptidase subunit